MRQRGRKSGAGLAVVVDVGRQMPAKPPAELTDAQAAVWRDVVGSMRSDWLVRGAFPVLIQYCRHVCRARLLEAQIAHFETEWTGVQAAWSGSTSCWPWLIARRRPLSLALVVFD